MPKRYLHLVWKLWYPILTRLTERSSLVFLNYGYASDDLAPTLEPRDESDRACIQLYHRVAGSVDLQGKHVLEISCGHGGGAAYVAHYFRPASLVGIDRNPRAIHFCRRQHTVPALSFSPGDAASLKFRDESFDVVLNVEASHCYDDIAQFFSEVLRVLRPGGHFLYADFRPIGAELATLQRRVDQSGFDHVRRDDISPGVVRGMRLNTARYKDLIHRLVPRPLEKLAASFAGVAGSPVFNELESGKMVYFLYVLRKPKGPLRDPA